MRYSMLVYLNQMCNTLLEAAQYICTSNNDELKNELLKNGQEMLTQIRETLTYHEGDLKSPLLLEILEKIYIQWENNNFSSKLESLLSQFISLLPSQIVYQVRAVFFAELAEKWDSMSSVYDFMKNDFRFDPVVVLTPVFRAINKDGKQKQEIIYKDYLTPLGIPFYEYNEYNLEEDCPDLAFISQPYESCTLPEFWPENISKTTRLVYLPYFLPRHGSENNKIALCLMPVYNYSWKVIGFNEKHHEFYSRYSLNGGKNMLVTGIPKTDHIINLRENKPPLPLKWKKIQDKKVFLWNTWYDVTLSSFKFFDTIINWFDIHRDCALIWRPHPMADTVTKLYYPDLYPKFQECKKKAKQLSNVVLDENISYDAAFYYSDAMISDSSSMLDQYALINKPFLHIYDSERNKKLFENKEQHSVLDSENNKLIYMENNEKVEEYDYFVFFPFPGELSYSITDTIDFLDRVYKDKDANCAFRQDVFRDYLSLIDGQCGKRICNTLWNELHKEDRVEWENSIVT